MVIKIDIFIIFYKEQMNDLPNEIIDHILYFTIIEIKILSKVNKYFKQNAFKIRLGDMIIIDDFKHLLKLTKLDISENVSNDEIMTGFYNAMKINNNKAVPDIKINDEILRELDNLISLNLTNNKEITNRGISNLTNLTSLELYHNTMITDIHTLTNLISLCIADNNLISDYQLKKLPKLKCLCKFNSSNYSHCYNNYNNITSFSKYKRL
jgi:hypothetical protein